MAVQKTECWNLSLAAGNVAMPAISQANQRRLISVTCAFGMAVVRYSVSRGDVAAAQSVWPRLPAAGQWFWTLEPGEGLWFKADVATEVGGSIKDVP